MAINFPNSPTTGQLYTFGETTWQWSGEYWNVYSAQTGYITSVSSAGNGFPVINSLTSNSLSLKSFSGTNMTIIDSGGQLNFYVPLNGGGGGQLYYFNISKTQTPYRELATSATTASEQSLSTTVSSGTTATIGQFLTPSGFPGVSIIPGGVWSFYLHAYKQNSSASFNIYCDVYKRTTGGTETLLFSTDPTPITANSPTPLMSLTDAYYSGSTLSTTDRLLVNVRVTNTSNNTYSVTFISEGSIHYSYMSSPLLLRTSDIYVDSFTYTPSANTITIGQTESYPPQTIQINSFSGLTIDGGFTASSISATTYQNLPNTLYTGNGTIVGNRTVTITGTTSLNFSTTGSSNTLLINNNGRVGIGLSIPQAPLQVQATAIPSSSEPILRMSVSDNGVAYMDFRNSSSTDGIFVPTILGRQDGTTVLPGLIAEGAIQDTQDVNSTTPVTIFRSSKILTGGAQAVLTAKPLFEFRNWSTTVAQITANGNLILQNGGTFTDAGFRLDVSGTSIFRNTVNLANGVALQTTGTTGTVIPLIRGTGQGTTLVGGNVTQSILQGFPILFQVGNNIHGQFFSNTGNLLLQSGGTFTDAGFRFDVSGTSVFRDSITLPNEVSILGTGTGGLSIPLIRSQFTGTVTIGGTSPSTPAIRIQGNSHNFFISTTQVAQLAPTTGNLILQNGGTFTDESSSRLTVNSTSQGFLPPRMTTNDRNNINLPAQGLILYNTTTDRLTYRDANTWEEVVNVIEVANNISPAVNLFNFYNFY